MDRTKKSVEMIRSTMSWAKSSLEIIRPKICFRTIRTKISFRTIRTKISFRTIRTKMSCRMFRARVNNILIWTEPR